MPDCSRVESKMTMNQPKVRYAKKNVERVLRYLRRNMTHVAFTALYLVTSTSFSAADIARHNLHLAYSLNNEICDEAAKLLANDKACRAFDANCLGADFIETGGKQDWGFEEIAYGEYGYRTIGQSVPLSLGTSTIVYSMGFRNSYFPRILETWRVNAAALKGVLERPPIAIDYDHWAISGRPADDSTNAAPFAELLSRSEKISAEWSPVIHIFDHPYVVVRECAGRWVTGQFYDCARVIELTVVKISSDERSMTMCQFARKKQSENRKK